MNFDEIKQLVRLVKDEDLQEIEVKDEEKSIRIEAKRPHDENNGVPQTSAQVEAYSGSNSSATNTGNNDLVEVRAPQIGVFYTQKEEENEETFVEVGDVVDEETQVGLIEAMKMFNDVPSGHGGTIEEILVNNGESVEYNQVLMLIRPKEA